MGAVASEGVRGAPGRTAGALVHCGGLGARPVPGPADPRPRRRGDRGSPGAVRRGRGAVPQGRLLCAGRRPLTPASPTRSPLAIRRGPWTGTAGRWRLDVFREPHDGDVWICRRDARIRRPYADLIRRDANGLPFLTPEVVLLFRAKAPRDKDFTDLAGTLPPRRRPAPVARRRAGPRHPDHPWRATAHNLDRLAVTGSSRPIPLLRALIAYPPLGLAGAHARRPKRMGGSLSTRDRPFTRGGVGVAVGVIDHHRATARR